MIRFKKKVIRTFICVLTLIMFVGCSNTDTVSTDDYSQSASEVKKEANKDEEIQKKTDTDKKNDDIKKENKTKQPATKRPVTKKTEKKSVVAIPKYTGKAYVVINKNVPTFKKAELKTKSYETYSSLDSLGRCGVAKVNIGKNIMPTEKRGNIGMVKPSGWHTVKYDIVDGKYLYNRCHLIGFQLTGENANRRNLITGTRYMNVEGMLPFENMVADYVKETGNHVLYRVKPVYKGKNLVASGVHMEAKSVEDKGKGVSFNVFVFNVQPGISINYADGSSKLLNKSGGNESGKVVSQNTNKNTSTVAKTYVLNTNTKKFHKPSCSSVDEMKAKNKKYYKGTSKKIKSMGYVPCKRCNP